ncbi:MAG TPA: dihydropteroate synthase [Acidobacteriaceae bacterium]|jgi:dihydropteroate synthase
MAFAPRPRFVWQLRSRSLALGEQTRLMAIVNLTPDSFSGDGIAGNTEAGLAAAIAAFDGGADILDLGAESTRPNASPISSEEELERLLPVLQALLRERPDALISVDTYHAATARAAAAAGAEIINDVSGLLWDEGMADAVAETRCGLLLMHTRGRPQEWREMPSIPPGDVVPLVSKGLDKGLAAARETGIREEAIVLDPGFGFGKIGNENFELLAGLSQLHKLGRPLAIGLSRKGFLGQAIRSMQDPALPPSESRREATLAANVAAILAGAHILRVHDLQLTREAAAVADRILKPRPV